MESSILSEIEELKVIYKEIIEGCSFEEPDFYVKHLNELENGELSKLRNSLFLKVKNEGLPTEEEKLKQLINSEEWSLEKEDELVSLRYQINDNEKNIANVITPQRPPIQRAIDELKAKLQLLTLERKLLLGLTANEYVERESLFNFICASFFKDKDFKTPLFLNLDALEVDEIEVYISKVEKVLKKFSEENLKKIATLSFFLNPFSYCKEDIHSFLDKPICQLTSQQMSLFSFGSRNLSILSQATGNPPELIGETKINDLLIWFDKQQSVISTKNQSKSP